ncbi:hypothetical protein Tco_0585031 [Tanacetum coccineum]
MANQEQNPPRQEQPFVAAKQVSFNLEDIILNTNNEVALLYTKHTNKETFKCVSDFISKCCLRELCTRSPNMYKEYLARFWYSAKALENSKVSFSVPTGDIYGEVGVNTFRNAIDAHYLPHSSEYEDIIIKLNNRHREKVVPYTRFLSLLMMHKMKKGYGDGEVTPYPTQVFSVNNWALKPNQPEEPPFTDYMLAICTIVKPVVFKAPKPSSNAERVPQGTNPGAKPRHKKHSTSLKQPSMSSSEATKGGSSKRPSGFKTGHLKRKKESSSAMDSNPSQTSASTPVVAEMHKEDQQAIGGPTSLGATSEERANPQPSTVSTAKADPGKSAPSTDPHVLADKTQSVSDGLETVLTQPTTGKRANSITRKVEEDEASRTIKLEDLVKLVLSIQPSFKDQDSPEDDPIIVVDDSDEDKEADEVHATTNAETKDASVPKSSSPSSLSTELKELSAKFNELAEEVKGLNLTSQVAELETLQWELPTEFLSVPTQVEVIQAKLKTLDALPSLLHKVTNVLNQFAQAIASNKTKDDSVPSAGQVSTQPVKGDKNTNQATISQVF